MKNNSKTFYEIIKEAKALNQSSRRIDGNRAVLRTESSFCTERSNMIDYHGMSLFRFIGKIYTDIFEEFCLFKSELILIHGYRNGEVLKNYIRSENGLKRQLKSQNIIIEWNPVFKNNGYENEGRTKIKLIKITKFKKGNINIKVKQ